MEKTIEKFVVLKVCIETGAKIPVSNPHFSKKTAESIAANCNKFADIGYTYEVALFNPIIETEC